MRRALTVCLLLLASPAWAAPASQPATSPDWPAFHGGGPLLGVGADVPAPPMRVRWTYRVPKVSFRNSAAIVGQTVYIADDTAALHAIDLKTGQPRWTFPVKEGFTAAPLVSDGRVYLGDRNGVFHAVDAATGREAWKTPATQSDLTSANLTTDGGLVAASTAGTVFCLDRNRGTVRWQISLAAPSTAPDTLARGVAVMGAVAVDGPVGWLAACDQKLRSISLLDGQTLTESPLALGTGASPAVAPVGVIVGASDGKVSCFDPQTGKSRWTFDSKAEFADAFSTAAVADGMVVIGGVDYFVYGLEAATGNFKWKFETQGSLESSPAISAGRVYLGNRDGKFHVLDLKTGRELWKFDAGRDITAGPAIAQGVVVVGDFAGNVYCFEGR